ncbi:hypothetical protein DNI29_23290 [Hymenobacter sediminis]|uniref:hypothetical protein n=1 Tax=Hymenobacter sediminis TaxID=2218621 RepID=UPI000F4F0A9E|nr:hypothetical protein [Hymenobacter sediminis]RPD43664.1 hypothetical protein DNI29_23290 [Hymenobacter sediminis]
MHTQLLPSPTQPSLAVLALLLLGDTDLFASATPLTVPVLPLPLSKETPLNTPTAELPERLAA